MVVGNNHCVMKTTVEMQNDARLLRRLAQSGDPEAFSEITRLYTGMVYGTCLRITGSQEHAADAAQETFYHLLKHAGRITGSLAGWLHQVARRRAIDLVRRDASRRRRESDFAAAASPAAGDQWADVSPLVDEAISELEPDLRDILLRHYLGGQSTVAIAAATGLSQPTISRRLEQALEELRGKLRAKGLLVTTTALAGLMPAAATSAPGAVVQELGKMGLTAAGAHASEVATTVLSGLKMKLAVTAAVALFSVGGFLAYRHNQKAHAARLAAAQPAVQPASPSAEEMAAMPENRFASPSRAMAGVTLPASPASAPTVGAASGFGGGTAPSGAAAVPEAQAPWGEAVEGVQVRLRAQQTNWNAGAIPRLYVDVRNQGPRSLLVARQMYGCELEVDGQWFRRPAYTREARALPSPFPPGRQYDNIVLNVDQYWEPTGEPAKRLGRIERFKLTPGPHTMRVAVTATADKTAPGPPIRAISNPVVLEIVAAPDAPAPPR